MNKNKEWEKNRRKLLNDYFVEVEPDNKAGEFIVDGTWYTPKWGCDTLDMVIDEIESLISQAEDNMRKAYGGCDNCFGKGYSTQHDHINCCTCDRGKQLDKLIKEVKDNMRKRCVEALPKKVNKIEHWGHEIDCYYCVECQEGVDIHPEHLEGFNEAIDQATQNINNLDKE